MVMVSKIRKVRERESFGLVLVVMFFFSSFCIM